jgi:hypothetical protein
MNRSFASAITLDESKALRHKEMLNVAGFHILSLPNIDSFTILYSGFRFSFLFP